VYVFLPLADGFGDSYIGCAHLERGATLDAPSITHAAALLVVHGRVTITVKRTSMRIQFLAGMGAVFGKEEPYSLESDTGAIILIVEAGTLAAQKRGISSPDRIAGQRWPGDDQTVQVHDCRLPPRCPLG
jgi:hypothetical protein